MQHVSNLFMTMRAIEVFAEDSEQKSILPNLFLILVFANCLSLTFHHQIRY